MTPIDSSYLFLLPLLPFAEGVPLFFRGLSLLVVFVSDLYTKFLEVVIIKSFEFLPTAVPFPPFFFRITIRTVRTTSNRSGDPRSY